MTYPRHRRGFPGEEAGIHFGTAAGGHCPGDAGEDETGVLPL
jgi:hypothetical protein